MEKSLFILTKQVQELIQQNRIPEAVYALEEVASWVLSQLAILLTDNMYQFDKGEACLKLATMLDPGNWAFASNLSHVFSMAGKRQEAKIAAEQAIKWCQDDKFEVWYNYGVILTNLAEYKHAVEAYKRAIERSPKITQAHYNIGISYLLLEEWLEGWRHYEYRFNVFPKINESIDRFEGQVPIYQRHNSLIGKTIYIFNEQGIGDLFNFIRYVPILKKLGAAKIILECQKSVGHLIARNLQVDEIVLRTDRWPDAPRGIDYAVSICSLPGLFNAGIEPIPSEPYIFASQKQIPDVLKTDNMKIGICWAGNPDHPNDFRRSCCLTNFSVLQIPGVQLFSFQKSSSMIRTWKGKQVDLLDKDILEKITDLSLFLKDFTDVACLLNEMDLVISVDTSIAHLSGAMGKPTWLLIDYINDWRWGVNSKTTNWYPSMTIFRQKNYMDWEPVFNDVVKELVPYRNQWLDRKNIHADNKKDL